MQRDTGLRKRSWTPPRPAYQNPYTASSPKRPIPFQGNGKWYLFILLIGSALLLLYTPFFRVTEITVTGIRYASTEDVQRVAAPLLGSRRGGILPNDNTLTLNTRWLEEHLKEVIADRVAVSQLSVEKQLPNSLVINVVERIPSITWISQDTFYRMDRSGIITDTTTETERDGAFPLVYDLGNTPTEVGEAALSPDQADFVFDIQEGIPMSLVALEYFMIPPNTTTEIRAHTREGWDVYFDLNVPFEIQRENLELLLQKRFTAAQRRTLDYIDVRYTDRVYFK